MKPAAATDEAANLARRRAAGRRWAADHAARTRAGFACYIVEINDSVFDLLDLPDADADDPKKVGRALSALLQTIAKALECARCNRRII
jgi:hypothetical protein